MVKDKEENKLLVNRSEFSDRVIEALFLILVFIATFIFLSLISFNALDPAWSHTSQNTSVSNYAGYWGAVTADFFLYFLGYVAYFIPVSIAVTAWLIFSDNKWTLENFKFEQFIQFFIFMVLLATLSVLMSLNVIPSANHIPESVPSGGLIGKHLSLYVLNAFGFVGGSLLLTGLVLVCTSLLFKVSWLALMDWTGKQIELAFYQVRNLIKQDSQSAIDRLNQQEKKETSQIKQDKVRKAPTVTPLSEEIQLKNVEPTFTLEPKDFYVENEPKVTIKKIDEDSKPVKNKRSFRRKGQKEFPPLDILDTAEGKKQGFSEEQLSALSELLEVKLKDYRVIAEVVEVHPGPVITRFELMLAPGIKVSTVVNISKDIARSLSVTSVRIVDVIPGRSTIGIEIPNEVREVVRLRELLESKIYQKAKSPLTIALGKNISGNVVINDLAKMPHLLVAGTTGSGKSVAVNAMLLSILYKSHYQDVKLIMIDPKMLELNVYDGIPHLLTPVVTDMKEASNALRWCVAEMERRYKLMSTQKVRSITGFNDKITEAINKGEAIKDPLYRKEEAFDPDQPHPTLEPLPYIVVVVDEFADMMMVVGKKVEELIARIAQKARAAGIHLILATQRPSVDVVTGLIKANIPSRIAMKVSSKIDSRTVIDQMGADQLLGHGDMLFMAPGTSLVERVHGAFVDDREVNDVVRDLKQIATPIYIDEILDDPEGDSDKLLPGEVADGENDELFDEAVSIVTKEQKVSISYLQRRLKIGYNRSARIVEEMEIAGVVSPMEHGVREVLANAPPEI